ncbi:TPA: hypothetical protein ACGPF1_001543 [Streptococcus suis]
MSNIALKKKNASSRNYENRRHFQKIGDKIIDNSSQENYNNFHAN